MGCRIQRFAGGFDLLETRKENERRKGEQGRETNIIKWSPQRGTAVGGVVIEHISHIRLPWSKVSLLHLFTAAQVNYKAPTLPPSRPAALETLMGVGGLHHRSRHQLPRPPAVS